MPVEYRISGLSIDSFRGVGRLNFEFAEASPIYLVGGNNSGKSTILNALALALRGGGFHTFTPQPFDFYVRSNGVRAQSFSIDLHLEALTGGQLPAVQGVGNPKVVSAIRVRGSTEKNGRLTHRHVLVGTDGKELLLSPRTALKGAARDEFQGQGLGWAQRYARPHDLREYLPEVWLLTPENLGRSLYQWKTGPLSRLSELLTQRFLEEEWEFDYHGEKRAMPRTIRTVHSFFKEAVAAFPFWKDELRPRLEESLSRYIGRQASVELRPDIQTIEEWMVQQLVASFAADEGGSSTPLDRMGDGWQALVRVAALDVLKDFPAELRDYVVILFEEPETYLHPHLRRKLRDVLAELAKGRWFLLCATHSPEFIEFGSHQQIHRLWRQGGELVHGSLATAEVSAGARFQEKLDEQGNHEFLFASKAVLCEGKDDAFGLRSLLRKLETDLEGRGVSILGVGGISNLPEYARMANNLKIPWCSVFDEDLQEDGSVKPRTQQIMSALRQLEEKNDNIVVWRGDLERCLKLTSGKAKPEWQEKEIEGVAASDIQSAYPDFFDSVSEVKQWIETSASEVPASPTQPTGFL